jgi:hypothetical protein
MPSPQARQRVNWPGSQCAQQMTPQKLVWLLMDCSRLPILSLSMLLLMG